MESQDPSLGQKLLLEAAQQYETVRRLVGSDDNPALGISITDIDDRLLRDISGIVGNFVDNVNAELLSGVDLAKEVTNDLNDLPSAASRQLDSARESLNSEAVLAIPSRAKMLLANFQSAVEEPTSLYPRLICCDAPVDPSKVVNFAKQYRMLDQILQADERSASADRSMPSVPKSGADVITNVNSSLESVTDILSDSVQSVKAISESFNSMKASVESFESAHEPVKEFLRQIAEARERLSHFASVFIPHDESDSVQERDIRNERNALELIVDNWSLTDDLVETQFIGEVAEKYEDATRLCAEFIKDVNGLLSRGRETLSNFVSILKRLAQNLPRIAQELRQFFIPTGLRAFILKPSSDLLSLLQSIDNLSSILPDPEATQRSMLDKLEMDNLTQRVDAFQGKLVELSKVPGKLLAKIEEQDLHVAMSDSAKTTLESVWEELQGSLSNAMDLIEEKLGFGGAKETLQDYVPFRLGNGDHAKGGSSAADVMGMVQNVTGAGGLFKSFL